MRLSPSLLLSAGLLAGLGLAFPATAQPASANTSRQSECQKQAADKGLRSGPERRDFMRECVHGKGAVPATPAQPAKPATPDNTKVTPKTFTPPPPNRKDACNQEADQKVLRGTERRDFMRGCMGAP